MQQQDLSWYSACGGQVFVARREQSELAGDEAERRIARAARLGDAALVKTERPAVVEEGASRSGLKSS
ncbi:hypothetical protein [Rhodopseudomonas parapalustris]